MRLACLLLLILAAGRLPAEELAPPVKLAPPVELAPIHGRIDELVFQAAEEAGAKLTPPADDAEFLRRICLDLTGRIPTAEQTRAFLADSAPDKRRRLIDRLLASPQHLRRMQQVFDVMLMQRLPAKHVKQDAWQSYLYRSFQENKSWRQLTRELLTADGGGEQRAAARFLLDRELKQEAAVRDIGRVFLGRDLQCAQCHDHPHLGDYLQRHYYGISAFLSRSYVFNDPQTKQAWIGEKADGVVKFTSVFTGEEEDTAPRILELPAIPDPPADKQPYVAKPDKKTRGVPKYSRRLRLAAAVTDPANRAFRRNMANRLWALLIGRGLIEPVDMIHANAETSHPQLLELLADDLHDSGYDMRRTIRQIALSQTYQRSSRRATEGDREPADAALLTTALLKPLTPEQLAWSVMVATGAAQQARQAASSDDKLPQAPGLRELQLERQVDQALAEHVQEFVDVFASGNELTRFDATAKQALFLRNGKRLSEWLQSSNGSLVAGLASDVDPQRVVEELYVRILSRLPSNAETQAAADFLAAFDQRQQGVAALGRAMICSAEFRFNH